MGTILNFCLKSGISLCLEGTMMVTIINLKKKFYLKGECRSSIFLHLLDQLIDSTLKTVVGGVSSGKLKVCTFKLS